MHLPHDLGSGSVVGVILSFKIQVGRHSVIYHTSRASFCHLNYPSGFILSFNYLLIVLLHAVRSAITATAELLAYCIVVTVGKLIGWVGLLNND